MNNRYWARDLAGMRKLKEIIVTVHHELGYESAFDTYRHIGAVPLLFRDSTAMVGLQFHRGEDLTLFLLKYGHITPTRVSAYMPPFFEDYKIT